MFVLEVRFHHVSVIRVDVDASQRFSAFIERDQNEDVKLKVYFAEWSVRLNQGLVRSQKCHDFLKIVETAMFMLPPKGGVEIRGAKLILARDISVCGTGTGQLCHWYFRNGSLFFSERLTLGSHKSLHCRRPHYKTYARSLESKNTIDKNSYTPKCMCEHSYLCVGAYVGTIAATMLA